LSEKRVKIPLKEQIMRAFSISERKTLELCPYVLSISPKNSLKFCDAFKELILKGSEEGLTQVEFFNLSLGVTCFDKKYVDTCLNRWRNNPTGIKSRSGRKKSIHKMSIEELKAENAYQKEVIAHLKKLRGITDEF
jgi:hypothetical protein